MRQSSSSSCSPLSLYILISVASALPVQCEVDFQRDIKPILARHCFQCHGPDGENRAASLRLDNAAGANTATPRGAVIKPGSPEESLLWKRITHARPALRMPPPHAHKDLSPEQISLLGEWIKAGAKYSSHWSFESPIQPQVPPVRQSAWPRNSLDNFVLAKLEQSGLKPEPEEKPARLLRRLSLDLTGLPPTPAELKRFLADRNPGAYERMVDYYLSQPAWGEHRARYWLDAARYGDTHGLHSDNLREIWPWRDWVINAFNRNLPFDQFTIDQIAGDLVPNPTLDQRIATGFLRNHIATGEGGVIADEVRAIYVKDQVDTVGAVWMGLTLGCAACHDHKYDPISQKDFYRMAAFFNNTTEVIIHGEISAPEPTLVIPAREDAVAWESLEPRLRKLRHDWRLTLANFKSPASKPPTPSLSRDALHAQATATSLNWLKPFTFQVTFGEISDHQIQLASFKGPGGAVEISLQSFLPAVRMSSPDGRHSIHVRAEAIRIAPVADRLQEITVTWDGSGRPEGLTVFIGGRVSPTRLIPAAAPLPIALSPAIKTTLLYPRRLSSVEVLTASLVPHRDAQRELDLIQSSPTATRLHDELEQAEQQYRAIRLRGHITLVAEEKETPASAHLLIRGQYDQPGELLHAVTPGVLPPLATNQPANRLGLARWLVDPRNPLTARVAVNRFWQELYGAGIVKTTEDFGSTGDAPSHPQLLDYLAVTFRDSGWDVKALFRLMVTSATYRQSAAASPAKRQLDPENRLLSRGPRYRMDGEMLRDLNFAQAGLLVSQIGGPSVRPRQPEGVWESVALLYSNTRFYRPDSGNALHRRGMYTLWKRAAPPPAFEIFNAPTRETCVVRRERTNTPLQALVSLNNPDTLEAARHIALRSRQSGSTFASQLTTMALLVLSRPLQPDEVSRLEHYWRDTLASYTASPQEARKLTGIADPTHAAWTQTALLLLNLDEALTK